MLELTLGKLTDEQADQFNQYGYLLCLATTDISKLEDLDQFVSEHSDIKPLITKWKKFWNSPNAKERFDRKIKLLKNSLVETIEYLEDGEK